MFQVVFSDESTIAVLEHRVQTVSRRSGEEFLPDCLKKTVKFPAKIMVWGAISVHGTSRLHIVEGTMNQIKYIELLEERLLPQLNDWFPDKDYIFQQDGAPCHTGKMTKKWFHSNKIRVLKWLGNSSDMNSIENLWESLKNEIHSEPISTKREQIEKLINVWFHSEKISKFCKNFIESMPEKNKALKSSKGGQTKSIELFQHNSLLLQQKNYSAILTSFMSDSDFVSKNSVFFVQIKKIHNNFSGTE